MVGPKLDARSYTTLVLTVVALLLALNLAKAQYSGADQVYKTEAAALSEVANATRDVAKANDRIAAALEDCASALGKIKLEIPPTAPASSTPAASGESTSSSPSSEGGAPSDSNVVFDMGS